jgi:multidrug efflux pump subunit AcrA (membrane-fusion protein)
MMRSVALPIILLFAATLLAQDELPKDPSDPLDIEPPLLIQETPNRNIVSTTPTAPGQKEADPERIALALEKARKNAASGERLYKGGIIAKVDAENRVLKVIRLEADLAEAKLELAKQNVELQQVRVDAGEISPDELETAKSLVAAATKEAESAAAKKDRAELDAAMLNLQRQRKLLAMGSGRKSEVNRAQEKVFALQQKN